MTVHAIVLKRKDAGESDRRLTVLTSEQGKIDVVAKGARKAASRLAGTSDPLSLSVMSVAAGRQNRFVTQAQPVAAFRALRNDFDRLSMALALTELYAAVLPFEQPDPDAFELLRRSLEHLERHSRPLVALIWCEVRLLETAGFMPQFDRSVVSGSPMAESQCWLSPSAGGYVRPLEAETMIDRFTAPVEVLMGLSRIGQFEAPPSNLKMALECLGALLPFWRHIADMALPANEALIQHLRSAGLG